MSHLMPPKCALVLALIRSGSNWWASVIGRGHCYLRASLLLRVITTQCFRDFSLPRHSVALRSHAHVYQLFFCERCGPLWLGVGFCERHGDCIFSSARRPVRVKLLLSCSAL